MNPQVKDRQPPTYNVKHRHQQHNHRPLGENIKERGAHSSRINTMPHKAVVSPTGKGSGSVSPVSFNLIGSYSPFRRDSGGSSSDRRDSGSSNASRDRRDSGGSTYSRGRKDSGESTTTTPARERAVRDVYLMRASGNDGVPNVGDKDNVARDRRDSGSSDKSEDGKKRGIFRQLMKWSSPAHHLKSKKEKQNSSSSNAVEVDGEEEQIERNGKAVKDSKIVIAANVNGDRDVNDTETQFKMSTEFKPTERDTPSPLTSPRKSNESRASTLTDVTNSHSTSDCQSCSCSVSGSGSESGSDEDGDVDEVDKKQDDFDCRGTYRPYYAYYDDYPRRVRSQSLDFASAHRELRRRRFSENHEWIRGETKQKIKEKEPSKPNDSPKAYTIYESILQEMGVFNFGRRGSLHGHRPADVALDPAHAAILFRDSRGLPVADPFLERILTLSEEDQTEILAKFFKFHKCYDLIPTSAKLVVFDTQLLVKKAFFALVYNGVRAAPLWDSSVRQFVGMLTITDFIRVLHAMYHDSAGRMSELEEHRIETWRRRFLQDKQPLIFIDPDASLYDAICCLVNNRIHRLPIIDQQTGNVLHILTHKRILKFLFLYIHEIPRPAFMNQKLGDVRIGTFDDVETAREDTSIIQALQKFLDRRVSALPIVDEQNRLLDIYARFDVINLAAEKTYNNLDITLKQANEHRNEWFEGVHKCTLEETLFVIMERIMKAEVHRLVVVDEQDRVVGVLSLSDILQYLVMRPEVKDVKAPDLKELILRSESPRPDTPSSPSPPAMPSEDTAQTNEANNNSLSPDLNGRDNPTIIEEEDEKM
ncbi:unnamed protein product [Orchesella dallaii]|uniref:CBS domain-containing protein n=1 Tax=Orchesella dallaii TaxID=48710 RepID=A0ABP1PVY4_9HEXA